MKLLRRIGRIRSLEKPLPGVETSLDAARKSACATDSSFPLVVRGAMAIFELARGLARELSDESAYERHLRSTGHVHSATEWKAFSDQRHRRKYQNAKCC